MDPALLRAAYDREASRYDERFAAQQRPKFAALAERIPAPAAGERVLDLGGGTGLLREHLVLHHPGWEAARFVVADLSTAMLRRAALRSQAAVVADARRLPFARAAFARVFCVTGLVDPAHVERALPGVARVLVPGGLFGLTLRPRDVPTEVASLLRHAPFAPEYEGEAEGDRLFVWRRQ